MFLSQLNTLFTYFHKTMDLLRSILPEVNFVSDKEMPLYICPWCHSECQYTDQFEQYVKAYDKNPHVKRVGNKKQANTIYIIFRCNNCVNNNYNNITKEINDIGNDIYSKEINDIGNDIYSKEIMEFKAELALFHFGVATSHDKSSIIVPKFSTIFSIRSIQVTKQLANICRFAKFINDAILFQSNSHKIKIIKSRLERKPKPGQYSVDRFIKGNLLNIIDDIYPKLILIHYTLITQYLPRELINIICVNIIGKYLHKIIPVEEIHTVFRFMVSNDRISDIITKI